ncbi:MAG: hypothetical protein AAGA56_04145 [Myxococcota bacterium]
MNMEEVTRALGRMRSRFTLSGGAVACSSLSLLSLTLLSLTLLGCPTKPAQAPGANDRDGDKDVVPMAEPETSPPAGAAPVPTAPPGSGEPSATAPVEGGAGAGTSVP